MKNAAGAARGGTAQCRELPTSQARSFSANAMEASIVHDKDPTHDDFQKDPLTRRVQVPYYEGIKA